MGCEISVDVHSEILNKINVGDDTGMLDKVSLLIAWNEMLDKINLRVHTEMVDKINMGVCTEMADIDLIYLFLRIAI